MPDRDGAGARRARGAAAPGAQSEGRARDAEGRLEARAPSERGSGRIGSLMATWEDVSRFALALPEAVETDMRGNRAWKIADKLFVWERPLRKSDLAALGESAPAGPILGARVE